MEEKKFNLVVTRILCCVGDVDVDGEAASCPADVRKRFSSSMTHLSKKPVSGHGEFFQPSLIFDSKASSPVG